MGGVPRSYLETRVRGKGGRNCCPIRVVETCVAAADDWKGRDPANYMGDIGGSVGPDSLGDSGDGPVQVYGAQPRSPQANPGRHYIPDAQRVRKLLHSERQLCEGQP